MFGILSLEVEAIRALFDLDEGLVAHDVEGRMLSSRLFHKLLRDSLGILSRTNTEVVAKLHVSLLLQSLFILLFL